MGWVLVFLLLFSFFKNLHVLVWFAWYHMILQINVSDEQSLNIKRQYFNFLQLFGFFLSNEYSYISQLSVQGVSDPMTAVSF